MMAEREYVVERYHDICAGHRVVGHENKCAHLHGHNYRITFYCAHAGNTVVKPGTRLDNVGRVIDFSVIKETLCEWLEREWDHKMLLWERDPWAHIIARVFYETSEAAAHEKLGVVKVPFNPTAENMAAYLVNTVGPELLSGTGVQLVKVKVEETRKCSVTYTLPES